MTIRYHIMVVFTAMALASSSSAASYIVGIAHVIDGDTLEIGGTTIRLNGLDALEHGRKCGSWRCGAAATDAMAALAEGVALRCEAGPIDGYGRVIATCWSGETDIGAQMVRDGSAWAFVRYSDAYIAEETGSRAARRGFWAYPSVPAWEYC